jgi:hypothetical protein
MFYPQANFYPQPGFYPQTGANFHPQAGFGVQGNPYGSLSPLSLYGISQQTPAFVPQQLLAQQQSMRPPGITGLNGISNGATQPGAWPQQQLGPEQFSPGIPQQPYHHLLQQLAQYHHLVAQQLTQLAAQSAQGNTAAYPFAGQFVPNPLGTNFVSGITMH